MRSWEQPGYLSLWDALRLFIAISDPDGERIAELADNRWGAATLYRENQRFADLFNLLHRQLEQRLAGADVHGIGNTPSDHREHEITEAEWGTRWIEFAESKRRGPSGTNFPTIISVRVRAKDIRSLVTASETPNGYRTGLAGRPSSATLCIGELKRRIETREAAYSVFSEAKTISAWLENAHPDAPRATAQTLRNNAGFKSLVQAYAAQNKKQP